MAVFSSMPSRLALPVLLAIAALAAPTDIPAERRAPSQTKSVIIQLFEWSWASVASECTNFIGPAGYGYVQVSPPAEHIAGTQWWTDYQPVSYTLTSKRGNRSQFASMVTTCHAAGVKVIVDTLWNHMAGIDGGTGVGGSTFTHYNYPGIYQTQDFHHCGLESGDDIVNYNSRTEVQTCELSNLADLATETEYVRARLATYTNDLLSLGVDGLRLDAAKHIATGDIANIISRLTSKPYITQEVIFGSGEPVTPAEYVANGDVQEFRYTSAVKTAFLGGGITSLSNVASQGWVASASANVFVANHDTERSGNSLNYNSPSNTYTLAQIFTLAWPYGTPSITSGYTFSSTDAGAPNNGAGTCSGSGGSNGWLCTHRWPAIAGLVKVRNAAYGTSVVNYVTGTNQQMAFGRGAIAFIIINNADSAWSQTWSTSLPNGTYCDIVAGNPAGTTCAGASYTVSSGKFTASVAARSALAIYTGALGTGTGGGSGTIAVTFKESATTVLGENIYIAGNIAALGNWSPDSALLLSSASYPTWSLTVNLPASTVVQYKYLRKNNGVVTWEADPNRQITVPASGTFTQSDTWKS